QHGRRRRGVHKPEVAGEVVPHRAPGRAASSILEGYQSADSWDRSNSRLRSEGVASREASRWGGREGLLLAEGGMLGTFILGLLCIGNGLQLRKSGNPRHARAFFIGGIVICLLSAFGAWQTEDEGSQHA